MFARLMGLRCERIDLDVLTTERLVAGLGDIMAASGERAFDVRLRHSGGRLDLQLVGDPETAMEGTPLTSIQDVFTHLETTLEDGRPGLAAIIDGPG